MENTGHQEAACAFKGHLEGLEFMPVTAGLINQSWKVTSQSDTSSFFLQAINTHVFPNAEGIQQNYFLLWEAISQAAANFKIPQPYCFANGAALFTDSQRNQWRVTEFLENTKTIHSPSSDTQLGQAAAAFGNFSKFFACVDPNRLTPSINNFHNLSLRFAQFSEACQHGLSDRITETAKMIEELEQRKFYTDRFEEMRQSSADFPLRVLHHDAKMSNLLFDSTGQEVIAVVDLDTTMPGLYFSDLGDMIRSMAGTEGENSTNWKSLQVSSSRYRALIEGYEFAMQGEFTKAEKEWLHYAGPIMYYMQSLRFLTDYLTGDHYYKTERPGQNRDRANNQLQLLSSLEELLRREYQFTV